MNIRHGDINFAKSNKVDGQKVKHNGSFVFGLGETTGHKHIITVAKPSDMEIYETPIGRIFVLKSEGKLSHEEHQTITIPAGTYKQVQEIEKDWFQMTTRKVLD